jgi:hypothetical protein
MTCFILCVPLHIFGTFLGDQTSGFWNGRVQLEMYAFFILQSCWLLNLASATHSSIHLQKEKSNGVILMSNFICCLEQFAFKCGSCWRYFDIYIMAVIQWSSNHGHPVILPFFLLVTWTHGRKPCRKRSCRRANDNIVESVWGGCPTLTMMFVEAIYPAWLRSRDMRTVDAVADGLWRCCVDGPMRAAT